MKRAAMGASGLDVQSRRATASESGKRGRRRGERRDSRVDGGKAQEGNAAKATKEVRPKSAESAAEAASNGVLGSKASPSTDGEESKELQLPDRRVQNDAKYKSTASSRVQ